MSFSRTAECTPLRVLSDELRLLLRSADSPARMSAMVVDVPPGAGVPLHSHEVEEEGYFVLAGTLALTIGAETRQLSEGDFGHVPPGTAHGYRNPGSQPVRFLAWTVGGPIDEFFVAMSQRVKQMPRDAAVMDELACRFGVRMPGG